MSWNLSSHSMYLWETSLFKNTFHYVISSAQHPAMAHSYLFSRGFSAHLQLELRHLKWPTRLHMTWPLACLPHFLLILLQPPRASCCFRHLLFQDVCSPVPSAWNTLPLAMFIVCSLPLCRPLPPLWVLATLLKAATLSPDLCPFLASSGFDVHVVSN